MKLASALRTPELAAPHSRLAGAARALTAAARVTAETSAQRLLHAGAALELVSPRGVLERGYAIVTNAAGVIVRSPDDADSALDIRVTGGRFTATRTDS
jgi:exodeoxyribonuclease VII large subunit